MPKILRNEIKNQVQALRRQLRTDRKRDSIIGYLSASDKEHLKEVFIYFSLPFTVRLSLTFQFSIAVISIFRPNHLQLMKLVIHISFTSFLFFFSSSCCPPTGLDSTEAESPSRTFHLCLMQSGMSSCPIFYRLFSPILRPI